ncbi:iron chelate uptake ABC transporter family permease subunit [Phaeobacter sp. QD34_3]|uniref:ABC transporter permease n=1 Tax=unclassified Phaeobacter TaxID=2621772 RepID=UPI00237F0A4E|nr:MULTISPECIES: iron chelate uptake ABC transporter family permease subunit [unclassified Phaeobacter]MDE4134507.1 iron chelate uptake ABC transporter family permease subunit [Phaeobacter sp. QD34_3]MDE4138166.1 iron chelate uptake ABC transporter family permease subunit [Phaeobacter sp. QD34_24]
MRAALLALLALILLSTLSLLVGATGLDARSLTNGEAWALIRDSRLPRLLAALLTGASLAIAGQIMQLIARNRFVEPMTAGTGQSAILGILLVSMLLPGASVALKMALASSVALAGSLGFFAITQRLPPAQPLLVPLVGLVYGGVIGAGTAYVAFQADMLQYLEIWTSGEFSGTMRGRYELLWLAGLAVVFSYLVADQFSILGLGQEVSLNLGLNYRQVVMSGLVVIALVTGLTVVTVGMIPFIGLVVPNLVSRLAGDNLRRSLPVTALAGAALVLAADLLGRLVIHPFEIPASTVIGIIGAAVFLWMLYGKGSAHAA